MPALAITDHGYMYGAVDFYKTATKAGVKPIIGCEVYFNPERPRSSARASPTSTTCCCSRRTTRATATSWRSSATLRSRATTTSRRSISSCSSATRDGLIGTSACMSGILSQVHRARAARRGPRVGRDLRGHLRAGRLLRRAAGAGHRRRQRREPDAASTASSRDSRASWGSGSWPPTTSTTSRARTPRPRTCCCASAPARRSTSPGRMKFSCDEFYMKTAEEMAAGASATTYPEAMANTLEIAEKCNVEMEFGKIILPEVRGARGARPRRATCARSASRGSRCATATRSRRRSSSGSTTSCHRRAQGHRGVLPDRRRTSRSGPRSSGIGVGPGPRQRRRLDHRVLARHHEPRPDRATGCSSSAS